MVEANLLPEEPVPAAAAPRRQPSKKQHKKRAKKSRYGVPPPLTFDVRTLPRGHLLSLVEAASACRRTAQTLRLWTRQPNSPLRLFKSRDGYWRTTVGDVLDFLNTPGPRNRSEGRKP